MFNYYIKPVRAERILFRLSYFLNDPLVLTERCIKLVDCEWTLAKCMGISDGDLPTLFERYLRGHCRSSKGVLLLRKRQPITRFYRANEQQKGPRSLCAQFVLSKARKRNQMSSWKMPYTNFVLRARLLGAPSSHNVHLHLLLDH